MKVGDMYRMVGAAGDVLTHMGWQGTEVALAWMGAKAHTAMRKIGVKRRNFSREHCRKAMLPVMAARVALPDVPTCVCVWCHWGRLGPHLYHTLGHHLWFTPTSNCRGCLVSMKVLGHD